MIDASDSPPSGATPSPSDPASEQGGTPAPGAAPDPIPGAPPDATLAGYLEEHDRPPAFEGSDGHPYTVSIETERTADLRAPWEGFLVFPRWADTGLGVVGHVETPTLRTGPTREAVVLELGHTPLPEVKRLLDDALRRRSSLDPEDETANPPPSVP